MWNLLLIVAVAQAVAPSEQLMYRGEVGAALEAAAQEAAADPDDIEAQERFLDVALSLGLFDRAVEGARERVRRNPTSPDAHYLLGRALPSVSEARAAYERALKLEPLHARSYMGIGAIHTASQRFVDARDAYARAVRIDPTLREAWQGWIRAHLALEETEAALEVAQRAVVALPTAPEPYLTLAVLSPAEARETLEQGVRAAGADPRLHAALAEVLLNAGDARAARDAAAKALATDPTEPVALRVRLFADELLAGRLDPVGYRALLAARGAGDRQALDRLVAAHPQSATARMARAQAVMVAGDLDAGIADLRAALRAMPDEAEVQGQLALALSETGDHAAAAALFDRAWTQRPWDASLGLGAGRSLTRAGKHDDAIVLLAKLTDQRPFDGEAAIAFADALLAAGRREDAYQAVLKASQRQPNERLLIALMASAAQAGRYGEAADILEKIGIATNNPRAHELAAELRARGR